jgi:hypothetical protein
MSKLALPITNIFAPESPETEVLVPAPIFRPSRNRDPADSDSGRLELSVQALEEPMTKRDRYLETPTPLESFVLHFLESYQKVEILDKHHLALALIGQEYPLVLEGGVATFFAYTRIAEDILDRMHAQGILNHDGFGYYQKADPKIIEALRAETDTDLIC